MIHRQFPSHNGKRLQSRKRTRKSVGDIKKIMYLYKDNFLTESTFKMFNEEMLNSYKPRPEGWWTKHGQLGYESYGKGLSGENFNEDAPELVLGENYPEENNYVRSAMLMGSKSLPDVVRSIKKHMIEDLKFTNPLARMMWFQYHSNKHKVISTYNSGVVILNESFPKEDFEPIFIQEKICFLKQWKKKTKCLFQSTLIEKLRFQLMKSL